MKPIAAELLLLLVLCVASRGSNALVIRRYQPGDSSFGGVSAGWRGPLIPPVILSTIAIASTAIALSAVAPAPVHAASSEASKLTLTYGLDRDDRLLKCKANSNCISTSSVKSLDKYSAPWAFSTDSKEQFEELKNVVRKYELLKIVDIDDDKLYLRAEAKSAIPIGGLDDVEFKVSALDHIIGYRSNSREVVMAGPQVVGDGGSNRNRLESIKRSLGVREMNQDSEVDAYIREFADMNFIQQQQLASLPNPINFIDNSVAEGTLDMDKMIGEEPVSSPKATK